jgi:hypothetical protein
LGSPFGIIFRQFYRSSPSINNQTHAAAMNGDFSIAARTGSDVEPALGF